MALLYFYDATELDKQQISSGLAATDHQWQYVESTISLDNLNPETEVLSVFVSSNVTAEIIDALPKLRLIACRSTGFNNIALAKAEERGIAIVNVPSYGEATVAEYAFTLILALLRKLPPTIRSFDQEIESIELMGNDLNNKTLGVIGSGRIGQHVIKIAHGFEMRVIAYDPFPKEGLDAEAQFEYMSLDNLLAQSDIVTIHAPFVGSNKHLINEENIRKMKPSAVLINTARGELVDTKALTQALQEKRIAGAALDVIEGEQLMRVDEEIALLRSSSVSLELFENSIELLALHKMPNVIITPHNAFNSVEAVGRINATTVDNIIRYWYGELDNKIKPVAKERGKLLLTRHAESEWNATGQWSGITDVHLSEAGFHEAGKLGIAIRDMQITIDRAFCSQQIRALETLEGILDASQQFDVPIDRSAAINERDYGDYTGKNKWEMKETLGEDQFNKIRRGWDEPIPNGETLKMVYERTIPFYKETILPILESGQNVLIVAHGNSIRALMKYIESLDDTQIESLEMIIGDIVMYHLDNEGKSLERSDKYIEITPTKA
jgi:D-lactate dehydrogenase